ncbi:MAG: transcriptional regulator, partial [Hyphomicrobiales bacterium]|nr:transcriptional regulator [Hyphomicrobiales bacterium]
MVEVWQGDRELDDALRTERLVATGSEPIRRSLPDWFALCRYADVKSAI